MKKSHYYSNILITGGAGFIGSHLVRKMVLKYPESAIFNLDALTYAGNLENLRDIEKASNYRFIKGDIRDGEMLSELFSAYKFDAVIHLAAESHVDRSISFPLSFAETNVIGTIKLLEAARDSWKEALDEKCFYHISTDEVYGSLGSIGKFTEDANYAPNSPYSASKAASDHFVRSYGATYGIPYLISHCSNNYGSYQFPEKFIPLLIHNIIKQKPLPIYGDGRYIRDWLYVEDHVAALDLIFHTAPRNEVFDIGGDNEWENIALARLLCRLTDKKIGRPEGSSEKLIRFVKDRPGHDLRYAIDSGKLQRLLNWKPSITFEQGLASTIDWYLENPTWVAQVTSGAYQEYYQKRYKDS